MNQPQAPTLNVQAATAQTTSNTTNVPSSKYLDLARKIKEIETENAKLAMKLEKSNHHLFRLKLERNILMEKLNSVTGTTAKTNSVKEEIINEMNQKIGQEEVEEEII